MAYNEKTPQRKRDVKITASRGGVLDLFHVLLQRLIEAHGGTWLRTPCPNCHPSPVEFFLLQKDKFYIYIVFLYVISAGTHIDRRCLVESTVESYRLHLSGVLLVRVTYWRLTGSVGVLALITGMIVCFLV